MSWVRPSSRSGQRSGPPPIHPPTGSLDWSDPAAVAAWARDVAIQARDAIEAGKDATRPPGQRELGRRAAGRLIRQASRKLRDAFWYAGVGAPE